ncbi:zinc-binding dehydrogenase [Trichoderma evansii]
MSGLPSTTSQWVIEQEQGLILRHDVPLPPLGAHDVLVKIHAVSLNARDHQILNNTYMWGYKPGIVPTSDCAGSVLAVGGAVSRVRLGSRIAATFHRKWLKGELTSVAEASQVGAHSDDELVIIPSHLSFIEASTLPCAAVTAWNSLFCGRKSVKPGDVVLTQGSGGVSLFAIQFANAAGATVIATTGELRSERETLLRQVGASIVLSYRDTDWGEQAKAATDGRGVDFLLEMSGAGAQSAAALRVGGEIIVIGGSEGSGGSTFDLRLILGELRRVAVGSREQFECMNRAISACRLQPVVDKTNWSFEQAREALQHAESGKMAGKVVIKVVQD